MPTNILVVGGAGYIGSHMLLALKQIGYTPIVFDNLSTGKREAVLDAELIEGDLANTQLLSDIFATRSINAVMHFASVAALRKGAATPSELYQNNVVGLLNLLNAMTAHQVKNIVYASNAAVFGEPDAERVHERHRLAPISTFGRTIKIAEEILHDFADAGLINFAIMRHFKVAGADPNGRIGDGFEPATSSLQQMLEVAAGKRKEFILHGTDYRTADGSFIRDYLHVNDLCNAHLLALRAMLKGKTQQTFNLGNARGYTVKQLVSAVLRVTKRAVPVKTDKPLLGEPAQLVADPELARQDLSWQQRYQELDTIIQHAWQFMQKK